MCTSVPLATMLATGDYFAADQFTRDNLIKIGGPGPVSRGFVYWTEVDSLPETDLCTMERLWLLFSEGKFGYSIQKRIWDVENANFDNFIRRIGIYTSSLFFLFSYVMKRKRYRAQLLFIYCPLNFPFQLPRLDKN